MKLLLKCSEISTHTHNDNNCNIRNLKIYIFQIDKRYQSFFRIQSALSLFTQSISNVKESKYQSACTINLTNPRKHHFFSYLPNSHIFKLASPTCTIYHYPLIPSPNLVVHKHNISTKILLQKLRQLIYKKMEQPDEVRWHAILILFQPNLDTEDWIIHSCLKLYLGIESILILSKGFFRHWKSLDPQ